MNDPSVASRHHGGHGPVRRRARSARTRRGTNRGCAGVLGPDVGRQGAQLGSASPGHRRTRIKISTKTSERVAYGKAATVSGLLVTAQGVPIAHAPVQIQTAARNGLNQFSQATTATIDSTGAWSAMLPPGPSRIIQAVYEGSATVLPAVGQASVAVPTKITLSVSSRHVPWSGVLVLHGHLDGGYVPADGVALRLLIRLPGGAHPYEPVPFTTDAAGKFTIRWTWGRGYGLVNYRFAIATTATESDFPFAASRSRWIRVTFGLPLQRRRPPHHPPRRKRRKQQQQHPPLRVG